MPQKQLSHHTVLEWVVLATGTFNARQMWNELDIRTPEGKSYARVCLNRLAESGVIAKTGVDGTYRRVDNEKKVMEWEDVDPGKFLPIRLPFGIQDHCRIYPKSIIILAGSKNEGKTAFLLKCMALNMGMFGVDFFNSETGAEQFKLRCAPLNIPRPAPFKVYERYDNFADVIDPERLSIIDYLDLNSEVYLVGTEIDRIYQKLTTGCAIIGLQKPPPTKMMVRGVERVVERDLAYGGGFTAKRAVLYISLGSHKCKLVYVKTPADGKVLPANMTWSYDFDGDGYFTNIKRYYGESPTEDY